MDDDDDMNDLSGDDALCNVEDDLDKFNDMLRLRRPDNLGVRDIIPHLLLRLGREQECYDFLKWWATMDDKDLRNGHYDWDHAARGANVFEPIDMFCSRGLSLSHLVALTLLKLRLYLDMDTYHESEFGFGFDEPRHGVDRPVGRLIRAKMRTIDVYDVSTMREALQSQYHRLLQVVNDANPYFWEALVEEETPLPAFFYSPGSKEEAHLVLHQSQDAWEETEDAILMVNADTSRFTPVYQGTTPAAGVSDGRSQDLGQGTGELKRTRGTGNAFPSRFEPPLPTSHPAELFPPTAMSGGRPIRFVSRNDPGRVLVYADGACIDNGRPEPRAGWAIVCGRPGRGQEDSQCIVSGRLEEKGPFGHDSVATSNRAELRAAIAVLRLSNWQAEGIDSIVIATDSSYVVDGATDWVKGWVRHGWKTRNNGKVKNKDLWELLLGEAERWEHQGLRVSLWKIPRELNGDADAAAKQVARNGSAMAEFTDITLGSSRATATRPKPSPRVLALCLGSGTLFETSCSSLMSRIATKAITERAMTPEAALAMLSHESPPSVILVVDGVLARQKKVWERVIDHLRAGATVVLAGSFSGMVSEGEFNRFFARLGLPWQMGSYCRETVSLRPGVVDSRLESRLPSSYSQKALFAKHVERSAAWYTASPTSDEAAIAFAQVGSGRLGYIGDVNEEEPSDTVVLAMCGLL
ncbi:hypothetical protein FDECE_13343 [Fusarium decemcellulare]|nr:hypothetical protein FDECE_13343 [Fusarium decemcellulare]